MQPGIRNWFAAHCVDIDLLKLHDRFFVEAKNYASPGEDHRTANQIRLLRHHTNCFRARRRILFHVFAAVQLIPRIQKFPMIAIANELLELIRSKPFLVEIAKVQRYALLLQETSCLAAGGSRGLMEEFHPLAWSIGFSAAHGCSPQYRGTPGSISADQRSIPPAMDFASGTSCERNHAAASRLRIP